MAQRKVRAREGRTNQRWYREFSPSVLYRTEGFVFVKEVTVLSASRKGTICVFLAAVLYSIGGLCIKVIPWNGMSINGGRNLIALLVIGGYLALTRHRPKVSRGVLLGAVCICGTNTLFTLANKLTTAANAIVLQFTAPVFVMLLSAFLLRRRPKKQDIAVCAAVLLGVLLCFADNLEAGGALGNALALCAGLAYAGVFLLNDLPGGDPISSVFWGDVASAVIGLPFLVQEKTFTPIAVCSLVILGAFQVGLAYILLTEGLKTTPAVTASLISGIEPVLNPILVAVFYHETIGPAALAGAAIVLVSVVGYNMVNARQAHEKLGEEV